MFLVSPALRSVCRDLSPSVIVPVRIAALRMRCGDSAALDVYNVHLVSNERLSPRAQLDVLRDSITPLKEAVSVVLGGLSVSDPGEGRLDLNTGRLIVDSPPLVDMLADFHEVIAQDSSRVQLRDVRPQLLSRLDRLFTSSPAASLVGGRASAHCTVGVLDRALPSDHTPIEGRFLLPQSSGRFRVPRWAL